MNFKPNKINLLLAVFGAIIAIIIVNQLGLFMECGANVGYPGLSEQAFQSCETFRWSIILGLIGACTIIGYLVGSLIAKKRGENMDFKPNKINAIFGIIAFLVGVACSQIILRCLYAACKTIVTLETLIIAIIFAVVGYIIGSLLDKGRSK